MEQFITLFERVLSHVEIVLKGVVIALTGGMLVWVCAQVLTRYLFSYTPSYGEELARYMFVWIVFLSLPIVAKAGGHMAIETLTCRVKGNTLRTLRVLSALSALAFLLIMTYQGTFMMQRASFQTSPGLGLTMSWVYLAIPIGSAIMFCNVLLDLLRLVRLAPSDVR